MAIPDYADERAHKHFSRGFVGEKHGENGTGYRVSWSSTSGAHPTSVHQIDNTRCYCVFCGNRAFPIQTDDFGITGHACVCKDAMDELEWRGEYQSLLNEQCRAREALKKKVPIPKKEALLSVITRKFDSVKHYIDRDFSVTNETRALGITTGHPFDHTKEFHR